MVASNEDYLKKTLLVHIHIFDADSLTLGLLASQYVSSVYFESIRLSLSTDLSGENDAHVTEIHVDRSQVLTVFRATLILISMILIILIIIIINIIITNVCITYWYYV